MLSSVTKYALISWLASMRPTCVMCAGVQACVRARRACACVRACMPERVRASLRARTHVRVSVHARTWELNVRTSMQCACT